MAEQQAEGTRAEGGVEQGLRRGRALLELEFGKAWDFDDPGTSGGASSPSCSAPSSWSSSAPAEPSSTRSPTARSSRTAAVTAPGLMVMAIILFMGAVSGAHLNPAVSIAFAARGDFPWRRVPGYIIVQLLGATLACLFLWALLGKIGMLGATEPGPGISATPGHVHGADPDRRSGQHILGTASGAQNVGVFGALGVGGYIILAGLWSSPISGASMNPARSFGPDMALLDFTNYWAYVVGPLAGALIAVGFAWILRGPGGGRSGSAAAQGRMGTLRTERDQQ